MKGEGEGLRIGHLLRKVEKPWRGGLLVLMKPKGSGRRRCLLFVVEAEDGERGSLGGGIAE